MRSNQLPKVLKTDMIFFRYGFHIIPTLHLIFKVTELFGNFPVKPRLGIRVFQIIVPFQNPQFKEKAVFGLLDTLLKSFRAIRLNELVRVFGRRHVNDLSPQTAFPQNADCTKRRVHTRTVAVIRQQYLLCISVDQPRLPLGKRSAQRRHRLSETGLMQGNHIHIALTQNHIVSPGCARKIQPVQITALVKNRRLR